MKKNLYRASEYYLNKLEIPDSVLVNLVPQSFEDFELYYGTTHPEHKLAKTSFFYDTSESIFSQVISNNKEEFYLPSLKLASFSDGEFAEGFTEKLEVIVKNDVEKFCKSVKETELIKNNPIKHYYVENNCEQYY